MFYKSLAVHTVRMILNISADFLDTQARLIQYNPNKRPIVFDYG